MTNKEEAVEPSDAILQTAFFAVLFFLGSADQFFAFRAGAMNFRWGQALLFSMALYLFFRRKGWGGASNCFADLRQSKRGRMGFRTAAYALVSFIGLYAWSSLQSKYPMMGFKKLTWFVFNAGLSGALILAWPKKYFSSLRNGVFFGVGAVAGVILIDSIAVHVFGQSPWLGFAQQGYPYRGAYVFRAHAFYYEPCYASTMLVFAAMLAFVDSIQEKRSYLSWLNPGIWIAAAFLSGSRTGLLTLFVCGVGWFLIGIRKQMRNWLKASIGVVVVLALVMTAFGLTTGGRRYLNFLSGPMGLDGIVYRLERYQAARKAWSEGAKTLEVRENPYFKEQCQGFEEECKTWHAFTGDPTKDKMAMTSEGGRIQSWIDAWNDVQDSLFFGKGVGSMKDGRIEVRTLSMWLEILLESGLAGLLAFGIAWLAPWAAVILGYSVGKPKWVTWIVLGLPILAHGVFSMNMTSSFPRLDFWLLYFFGLRMYLENSKNQAGSVLAAP